MLQVADGRMAEVKHDAEELGQRHLDLKRRFRLLYNGYKALRYRVEDEWPAGAGQPPCVVREEVVVTGSLEEILWGGVGRGEGRGAISSWIDKGPLPCLSIKGVVAVRACATNCSFVLRGRCNGSSLWR